MVTVLVPVELDRESEAGIPVSTWMDDTAIRTADMLTRQSRVLTLREPVLVLALTFVWTKNVHEPRKRRCDLTVIDITRASVASGRFRNDAPY